MADKKTVKVKLVQERRRHARAHRATVRGLGLRKLNSESSSKTRPPCAA